MKYYLSLLAIFKNESHILDEWITHHIKEGVDHIYLINNDSSDNYQDTIEKWKHFVTLYNFPERGKQVEHYNKILPEIKKTTKWLLVCDLDEFVFAMHLFRPLRFFTFLSPSYWMGKRKGPRGERIRRALEDLGPIFVKFGQILSTRQDLLPPDIGEELSQLQDNVPPFAEDLARQIIEKSLAVPIEDVFSDFSPSPLASASVAQVHTATLRTGEDVVVKVLRPDPAHSP